MSWLGVAPEPLSLKSGASFDVCGYSDARACFLLGIDADVLSRAFRFIGDDKSRYGCMLHVLGLMHAGTEQPLRRLARLFPQKTESHLLFPSF
jgi:hypothetical protein